MRVTLRQIAHSRAGDKGNTSNVSVIAYDDRFYPAIKAQLTDQVVKEIYGAAVTGRIERFAVDRLSVLNFVMEGALGGGVSRSLALDNYGKSLASAVLRAEIEVPDALVGAVKGPDGALPDV